MSLRSDISGDQDSRVNRRTLAFALAGVFVIGIVVVAAALGASLWPSAATEAALPRVSTADIPKEGYKFVPDIYDGHFKAEVLLVRSSDGTLRAWFVPGALGVHYLPDGPWWKPGLPCRDFRPNFQSANIGCEDPNLPERAKHRYKWSLDGKRLFAYDEDMLAVPGVEEGGYFVFHKRRAS